MSELGPSSFEQPRSMDSPGRNADTPFGNQELYGRKTDPFPPKNPLERNVGRKSDYDEGDASYDHLLDYGAPGDIDEGDTDYANLPDYARGDGFEDPDLDYEHVEKATAEVRKSIHDIEAAQIAIAEHTGQHGQELTDSVDRFLTDHAEYAVDIDASDKADIVEMALVEGALEATGQRPEGTKNPILTLEDDGYDQAVTDAVRKLYEEGATLPNGESAAEAVATTVLSHEMQSEQYDSDSKEAGWDSPERAQKLVEGYVTPGSKVLDIGIGTGQAVAGYAEKGATVIGLDRDTSMLDAAGAVVGEQGELRQADINKELPIADLKESVDVAQAIGVLEFAEDLPGVLEQVHGSLKENGVFVFTSELVDDTHASKSEFEDIGLTVHRHTTEEIQGLLEQKGYKLLSQEAYDGYKREDGEVPYGIFLAQKTAVHAERPVAGDTLDAAMQQYMQGASKEDVLEKTGMDPAELTKVIRDLPPETQDYLKNMRRQALSENTQASIQTTEVENSPVDAAIDLGTALQAYLSGASKEDFKRAGLDPRIITEHIRGLPEEEQQHLKEQRQAAKRHDQFEQSIESNLEAAAPELLRGRLPKELADRIGSEYALGLRQPSILEVSDAQHQLDADGGVDVDDLGLTQSFEIIKREGDPRARGIAIMGYYGAQAGGKFVIAIPHESGSGDLVDIGNDYDETRDMLVPLKSSSNPNHKAVNSKYVAGFIDGDGNFHPNENFMRSNEAMLSGESASTTPQAETAEPKETTNPYEKLTPEQLTAVRDNIADSIVQGIRKYNPVEVARAGANLAAIQREIAGRSPEQPAHQRGEVAGEITYITEPDPSIVQKIVAELQKIDGAPDIARKLYGGLEIPQPNEQDPEARLQAMELQSLLANVSREIRTVTGSEFSESSNPYASMKNEELATTVERLKQAIQEGTAQGRDTTDFRNRLAQAGRVIQGRQ